MARLANEFERWHLEAEVVISGMKEWWLQHLKATFHQLEAAVDEKPSGMRARLLEDSRLLRGHVAGCVCFGNGANVVHRRRGVTFED